jgi:hypothetical protein
MRRALVAAALIVPLVAAGADRDWNGSARWSRLRTPNDGPPQ